MQFLCELRSVRLINHFESLIRNIPGYPRCKRALCLHNGIRPSVTLFKSKTSRAFKNRLDQIRRNLQALWQWQGRVQELPPMHARWQGIVGGNDEENC